MCLGLCMYTCMCVCVRMLSSSSSFYDITVSHPVPCRIVPIPSHLLARTVYSFLKYRRSFFLSVSLNDDRIGNVDIASVICLL